MDETDINTDSITYECTCINLPTHCDTVCHPVPRCTVLHEVVLCKADWLCS